MKNLIVLASGRGSDFQAILDHVKLDILQNVKIRFLVCNRSNAPVIERAKNEGIEVVKFDGIHDKKFSTDEERETARISFDRKCLSLIKEFSIDLVALAGFDQLVSSEFVNEIPNRIMNIHPAYDLTKFGGKNMIGSKVHNLVLQSGARFSGCTVHFVTNIIDQGPAIVKKRVRIVLGDTKDSLERRILVWEHLAYPEAIQLVIDGRVMVDALGNRCFVDRWSDDWEINWNERQRRYIEFHEELREISKEL